jgi:DnaJ-class molecular chaperone
LFVELTEVFGLLPFAKTLSLADPDLADKVQAIKKRAKPAFRELAKQVHPDMGGSDVDFRAVKNVYDLLQSFEIHPKLTVCPHCKGSGLVEDQK